MAFADVNGQRVWFDDTGGGGPPVVFSHGFLMDHTMFDPQVDALRDEFRCIVWDERGFGRTDASADFTYWDLADDCIGLLDHLGIEQAVLAGMSQGGFLSLRAALARPERVKALVLIDTQSGVEDPANVGRYQQMLATWTSVGPVDELTDVIAGLIIGEEKLSAEWIGKWREAPKERLAEPGRCLMGRDDITDRLGEISCPALVVHGESDQAIPMEKAEQLCDRLPGCEELVRVPGGSHAANLTHPDEVNPPLRRFLRQYA